MTRSRIPTRTRLQTRVHALAVAAFVVVMGAFACARASAQTRRFGGEPADSWMVTGRVVDQADKPVAGIALTIYAWSGPEATPTASSLRGATTATDGGFSVAFAAPALLRSLRIEIDSDVYELDEPDRTFAAGAPPPAPLTIRLEPMRGRAITGVVTDEARAPIAGATVTVSATELRATTGADGTYRIEGLKSDAEAKLLEIAAPGFLRAFERVFLVRGRARVETTLTRGGIVACVVVNSAGEPIAGATVVLVGRTDARKFTGVTAADGHAGDLTLPPGPATLTATAPGLAPRTQAVTVPAAGSAPLAARVVLTLGRGVSGRVVNSVGKPIERASVSAQTTEGHSLDDRQTLTDAGGHFNLTGLPDQDLRLAASLRGYTRCLAPLRADESAVVMTLVTRTRLAGRVIDAATHRPVTRFNLRVVPAQAGSGDRPAVAPATVPLNLGRDFDAPDGVWKIDDQPFDEDGAYGLEIRAVGHGLGEAARVTACWKPDDAANVIVLPRASTVAGTIATAAGASVPDTAVWILSALQHDRLTHGELGEPTPGATTDQDGAFSIDSLAPGAFHVVVKPPKQEPLEIGPFQLAAGQTIRDLRLVVPDTGTITGLIVNADGDAAPGARVEIRSRDPLPQATTTVVRAGADGRFTAHHVAAGASRVEAFPGDATTPAAARLVNLDAGGTQDVRLAAGLCSVRVVITGDTAGATELTIHVSPDGAPAKATRVVRQTSGATTTADIDGLSPGVYFVSVIRDGAGTTTSGVARATLETGKTNEVRVGVVRSSPRR